MRNLDVLESRPSTLERNPKDGFVVADPYPLSAYSRRTFRAMIRVLCPPAPAPQLADLEDRIEDHARRLLRYMPPLVGLGFVLAIHLLDWSPFWRFAAFSRVQKLDRERAEAILDGVGMSNSPLLRLLVLGVRGIVLSTYYDQDEVHAAIGYAPIPWLAARIDLRERILRGEEPTAADRIGPHSEAAS